jgi:hypothetical protein
VKFLSMSSLTCQLLIVQVPIWVVPSRILPVAAPLVNGPVLPVRLGLVYCESTVYVMVAATPEAAAPHTPHAISACATLRNMCDLAPISYSCCSSIHPLHARSGHAANSLVRMIGALALTGSIAADT